MKSFYDLIKNNIEKPEKIEKFFNKLKLAEFEDFKNAISKLRQDMPESDLINYWHYKLKIYSKEEKVQIAKPPLIQKPGIFNIIISLIIGFFCGIGFWILYLILDRMEQVWKEEYTILLLLTIASTILIIGFIIYFLISYKKIANKALFIISLAIYAVFFILLNIYNSAAVENEIITIVGMLAFTFFAIVFSLISISEKPWKNIASGLHKFINKFIEISILNFVFGAATGIIYALCYGLLRIIEIDIPEKIIFFIVFVSGATLFFLAWALVYDFKKKLTEQIIFTKIIRMISKLFVAISFITSIFLLIYLVALIPSKFNLILKTGNTSIIFFIFACVNVITIYFASIFLKKSDPISKIKKAVSISSLSLIIESIAMTAIAFYAIGSRISQYAFTVERYIMLFNLIFISIILIFYAYAVLRHLSMLKIERYQNVIKNANLFGIVLIIIYLFTISYFVNLEYLSIKSHFNKYKLSDTLKKRIDRYYIGKYLTPNKSIHEKTTSFIVKNYQDASKQTKLDIILALYLNVNYGDADYLKKRTDSAINIIKQIQKMETDEQITDFIALVDNFIDEKQNRDKYAEEKSYPNGQTYTSHENYYKKLGTFYNEECPKKIMPILKIDFDQAKKFCSINNMEIVLP